MPNDPETEAVVRGYVAAAAAGDLEGLWRFYAERVVYVATAVHQVYHGIEATKDFLVRSIGSLDIQWEIDQIVATDEGFGIGGFIAGRQVKDLPGLPVTNRTFRIAYASIATVRNGKILRQRDFWSHADLLEQLGFV